MPDIDDLLYRRVVAAVRDMPWAILPNKLSVILDLVRFRAEGGRLTAEEVQERIGAARPEQRPTQGAIAVLPIFGTIVQRADLMTEYSGGTSTTSLSKAFAAAVNDPGIGSIVLQIDSPGGGVYGVAELWQQIYDARGTKPIVAVADSLAASAAYWIATAADSISVTPSGQVGSIGVLLAHEDDSRALDAEGITMTLISAGKYKTEGNPFEPLSEEARAAIQARVDDYYRLFTSNVAKGRGATPSAVRSGFAEGRVVGAQEAVSLGMADRVESFDAVIQRLAGSRPRGGGQRADGLTDELVAELPDTLDDTLADTLPSELSADLDRRRRRNRLLSH